MRTTFRILLAVFWAALVPAFALAQTPAPTGLRQTDDVLEFTFQHTPADPNVDVYVLGSVPVLGGGDVRKATRMVSGDRMNWTLRVSLPRGTWFRYRFVARNTIAANLNDPDNAIPLSPHFVGRTRRPAGPEPGKSVQLHSTLVDPVLHWRQGEDDFQALPLRHLQAGRTAGEERWGADGFGRSRETMELYFTDALGGRDPVEGTYRNDLPKMFIQDEAVFTYEPAATVDDFRKDYNEASPPTIFSNVLGETRIYRVLLPRGYDQHTSRSYPVVYFYDGPAMWPSSSAGYDRNGRRFGRLIDEGVMGEMIFVAVDYLSGMGFCGVTENRLRDTMSNEDTVTAQGGCATITGNAQNFLTFITTELKPLIDSTYRTLPDRDHTFASGGSLGGLYALFAGWEFNDVFGAVGAQSASFWVPNFVARVKMEPKKDLRIYLDFGDLEVSAITDTVRPMRDSLMTKDPGYVLGDDLYLDIGTNQLHSFPAFGLRMRAMFTYLYPATREPSTLALPVQAEPVPIWRRVRAAR